MSKEYTIGIDYGTDSVRALFVDCSNGNTLATHVHHYQRWNVGKYCNPSINQFRQHTLDHIEGLENTIIEVIRSTGVDTGQVKGICIDTTGSSPIAVDETGTPLCLKPGFEENPNAMLVLWKDHTAIEEAEEINRLARSWGGEDFTKYEGGIYSSEWFWAKILHIARNDKEVKENAHSWMEHCDLMTYMLVGNNNLAEFKRSRCAAGHKAMWHESWGGLPGDPFLEQLDPYLPKVKKHLYENTFTSDIPAGTLNAEWAERLGLSTDVKVSVGTFDAHAGAVGAEVEEFTLVRVMGTSTCDIIVSPGSVVGDSTVKGICGQVDGSVLPGMIGLEAGQSAFGDVLAWFRELVSWPIDQLQDDVLPSDQKHKLKESIIQGLSEAAEQLPDHDHDVLALDWINGRRTPDANQNLEAAMLNLSLGSGAPQIFKALVEAICYGSKAIVDRFEDEGVEIKSVVGIGGVAKKSAFIMQTLANVLNMPIKIAVSEQAPALGAAMYASVAAGIHENMEIAMKKMGNGFEKIYEPERGKVLHYTQRYKSYLSLGNYVESTMNGNV